MRSTDDDSREYPIPVSAQIKVRDGDHVSAGDKISEGSISPQELLLVRGRDDVQNYLVREVQRVYRTQGVDINDKHIEVIVRQMMRKVRIDNAGDTDLLPGEIVSQLEWEESNAKALSEGGEPAIAQTVLLGLIKAALNTASWLSAASFQETTRVLTEAAISGKIDRLRGLKENVIIGKLIPAGTGLDYYQKLRDEALRLYEEEAAAAGGGDPDYVGHRRRRRPGARTRAGAATRTHRVTEPARDADSTHDPVTASWLLPDRELMRRKRGLGCARCSFSSLPPRTPRNLGLDSRRRLPRRNRRARVLGCRLSRLQGRHDRTQGLRDAGEAQGPLQASSRRSRPERRGPHLVDRSPGAARRAAPTGGTRCGSRSGRLRSQAPVVAFSHRHVTGRSISGRIGDHIRVTRPIA